MPVHLASKTGGIRLTTFSIAKSRKPINNPSTGPSLLFFGRKIKAALMGIPALLGMPIFLSRRYAPVFEVEPFNIISLIIMTFGLSVTLSIGFTLVSIGFTLWSSSLP